MTKSDFNQFPFTSNSVKQLSSIDSKFHSWPVVYTLFDKDQIYVGETINAFSRLNQHLANDERSHLSSALIIINEKFNKSASLDLESELIKLFAADEKFVVLNSNMGISDSDYYDRDSYRELFDYIFDEFKDRGLFCKSKNDIENSDMFKFSPFKSLNLEQHEGMLGILEILSTCLQSKLMKSEFVISGGPGTGKTVMAVFMAKLFSDISNNSIVDEIDSESSLGKIISPNFKDAANGLEIGLVIPQQGLRKTIENVFSRTSGLSKEMILTPYQVAESEKKYDILIVEEAHRLNRRANQPSGVLNKKWPVINKKLFGADDFSLTQLDWLREQSHHLILLLDSKQTVISRDISEELTRAVIVDAKSEGRFFELESQMRMDGGQDYLEFVTRIFTEHPTKAPSNQRYDLRFYESFTEMRSEIIDLNESHGLSRVIAGNAFPWNSKKDEQIHDIEIEGNCLFWNRVITDWINSPSSIEEIGCIHTVQGYDLNYAGVIIGRDLRYDKIKERISFDRQNYYDKAGMQNNRMLGIEFSDDDILCYVLNVYRVLLTRGVKGTFVFVEDEELRDYLRKYFP